MNLKSQPMTLQDIPFWKEMYSDPETQKQMYAPPAGSDRELLNYFYQPGKLQAFTVTLDGKPVGGFTVEKDNESTGTFGFVVHSKYRNRGFGHKLVQMVEQKAKEMGIRTIRADVYSDNEKS
jgi:RimJ/RimL family protein N-acetyltransferase